MKNIWFLFFVSFFVTNSYGQGLQGVQKDLPANVSGRNLYSISKFESQLFIAGDGCLLRSRDNGETWEEMYNDNSITFFDIKFCNNKVGYAVACGGENDFLNRIPLLYKSEDGGENWIQLFKEPERASVIRLNGIREGCIDFLDENRIVWGVGNVIYYSVTGGRANHWVGTVTGKVPTASAIFHSLDKSYYTGLGYITSNYGGVRIGGSGPSMMTCDMDLVSSDKIVAANSTSEILVIGTTKSNDYKYKKITGASDGEIFYGIDFLNDDIGYVVSSKGKIFYTHDGGNKWLQSKNFTSNQLNDILFYSSSEGIVIGNNGTLIKLASDAHSEITIKSPKIDYTESETIWKKIDCGSSNDLYEVEIKSGNIFVVGDGVILKSTDDGVTFSTIYSNESFEFRDISFVDSKIGWVIGYNKESSQAEILKTTDGGVSWKKAKKGILRASSAQHKHVTGLVISALNSTHAIASASAPFSNHICTTDGVRWKPIEGNLKDVKMSDFVFYGNNFSSNGFQGLGSMLDNGGVWLVTDVSAGAARTTQLCTSKTSQSATKGKRFGTNAIDYDFGVIAMARDLNYSPANSWEEGFFERTKVRANGYPLKASNWACYPTYTRADFYGIDILGESEIWMCGENGVVITTRNRNGGMISQTSAPEPQKEWFGHNTKVYSDLYDIEHVNKDIIIAIGEKGTIIRTANAQAPEMVVK